MSLATHLQVMTNMVDMIGAATHGKGTRLYAVFRDSHQNDYICFAELPGVSPPTNKAWIQSKCRRALCQPEQFTWTKDDRYPANPSLLVIDNIREMSLRQVEWPFKAYYCPAERNRKQASYLEATANEIEAGQDWSDPHKLLYGGCG